MPKPVALLLIMLIGAVILVPVVMALELDPMPGDFAFSVNKHTYNVPVLWSLCASGGLTLLYSLYRR